MKFPLSIIVFLLVITSGKASPQTDSWTKGIEACAVKDFHLALEKFSDAIEEMEDEGDETHPEYYVDRARVYQFLGNQGAALTDLNRAIETNKLSHHQLSRALVFRIGAYANFSMVKECNDDIDHLKRISTNWPESEETETHIIIRNVPDCQCFRNMLSAGYVSAGICDPEDIQFLPSRVCLVKKKHPTCCRECLNPKKDQERRERIEACKSWCDSFATASVNFCGRVFSSLSCQFACISVVERLKYDMCYRCCDGDGFYRNCIKPFENIVGHMGGICDPYFD